MKKEIKECTCCGKIIDREAQDWWVYLVAGLGEVCQGCAQNLDEDEE